LAKGREKIYAQRRFWDYKKNMGRVIGCVWNIWATASVASKFFLESKCGKERIFIYTHVCVCVCVCVCVGH